MLHPDVMVLGTGRSGTSFVSEILHNHYIVCMGHEENEVSRLPFKEYYECVVMFNATIRLCGRFGTFERRQKKATVEGWLGKFTEVHKECIKGRGKRLCGVKVKHLCWLTPAELLEIKPRLIVRTWRNPEDAANSFFTWKKGKKYSLEKWLDVVHSAEESLGKLEEETKDSIQFVRINIPGKNEPRISREAVIEILEPHMRKLKVAQSQQI